MAKIPIKTSREIELIRESCRIVGEVLALIGSQMKPGTYTRELDSAAEEYIRSNDAVPAFKGYGRDPKNLFPGSLCISIENEVVHGIPDGRRIDEGQVVSVDVGVLKDGYFGDAARTFAVGTTTGEKLRLLRVTEESLWKAIEKARAGNRLYDLSAAVQAHVEAEGFSVVRDLVGHGIGKQLHEEPSIPNFGTADTGPVLKEGMVLAIEPMVNAGSYHVELGDDGWTVRTQDGLPSAHFEHTVLVQRDGAEILTGYGKTGSN
ncbi:MAG: type I methionyl aminopeptidase [Bacteroidota bacterium]